MIGKLDRKIQIETKTTTPDAWGQEIDAWTLLGNIWAQYKPRMNSAAALTMAADQIQFREVASFVIRYRSDVPDTARIQYAGKTWVITQRGELTGKSGRRRYMELVCVAVNSDIQDGN